MTSIGEHIRSSDGKRKAADLIEAVGRKSRDSG
jgi:hypothetical protein